MTIKEQTGWDRPNDVSMLQDLNLLKKVTVFDFDLNDESFRQYCRKRKGYTFTPSNDKVSIQEYIDLLMTGTEMDLANYIGKVLELKKEFDKNLALDIKWLQITRAMIQDLWEIYNNTEVF